MATRSRIGDRMAPRLIITALLANYANGFSMTRANEAIREMRRMRQDRELTGRRAQCQGLVKEICTSPCAVNGGSRDLCQNIVNECEHTFCDPMCLRDTWTCQVKFPKSMKPESSDDRYSESICNTLMVEGCSKDSLECCAANEHVSTWINDQSLKYYSHPVTTPIPSCYRHNLTDPELEKKTCEECESGVQVKLSQQGKDCERFYHESVFYPYSEYEGTDPYEEAARKFFKVNKVLTETSHRFSLWWRCKKLSEKVESVLDKMQDEMQKTICNCIGCCGLAKGPNQDTGCPRVMGKAPGKIADNDALSTTADTGGEG
ncbi:hypothetical protein AAMO2058_000536100 [Amorphochlora amoebiformis]